jgi:bacteriocin-like protein
MTDKELALIVGGSETKLPGPSVWKSGLPGTLLSRIVACATWPSSFSIC